MSQDAGRRRVRLTPPPRVERLERRRGRSRWVPALALLLLALGVAGLVWIPRALERLTGRLPEAPEAAAAAPAGVESAPGNGGLAEDPRQPAPGFEAAAAEDGRPAPPTSRSTPTATPPAERRGDRSTPPATERSSPPRSSPAPRQAPPAAEMRQAMTIGLEALDRGDWQAAAAAFERARELAPGDPGPRDGLARAAAGLRAARIDELAAGAAAAEATEAWEAAQAAYDKALELDPALAFARAGSARARSRLELERKLEFHLANRERLSAEAVREEVLTLLATAAAVEPAGPRHQRHVAELSELVRLAAVEVPVVLTSDGLTEVTLYRVGRLGSFERRELALRPGVYPLVGRRSGYRDVRLELEVVAASPPPPLDIRCREAL